MDRADNRVSLSRPKRPVEKFERILREAVFQDEMPLCLWAYQDSSFDLADDSCCRGHAALRCDGQSKMWCVTWTRYQGRALADTSLNGDALHAQLEDYVRVCNPHLTDIRLERATATERYDTSVQPPRRWYEITYLADDT